MGRIETLKSFVEQLIFGIDVDVKRSGSRFFELSPPKYDNGMTIIPSHASNMRIG
jgi:hypothetical protein